MVDKFGILNPVLVSGIQHLCCVMKIDVYMSETCGSYYRLRENMERALSESGTRAEVEYHTIYYDDAVGRNIKGSPSVWINGRDAFESGNAPGIT